MQPTQLSRLYLLVHASVHRQSNTQLSAYTYTYFMCGLNFTKQALPYHRHKDKKEPSSLKSKVFLLQTPPSLHYVQILALSQFVPVHLAFFSFLVYLPDICPGASYCEFWEPAKRSLVDILGLQRSLRLRFQDLLGVLFSFSSVVRFLVYLHTI